VKTTRRVMSCMALVLASVTVICAQDLSNYRDFSLGASSATISRQVDAPTSAIKVIHHSPTLIQELTWWGPIGSSQPLAQRDSIQQIKFSFCDGTLYKIVATYDNSAVGGLTSDDLIRAISVKYGVATHSAAVSSTPSGLSFNSPDVQIASWEDPQYSATLVRSPLSESFQLIVLSKPLASNADAAIAEAVAQESESAPQRERARVTKEAEDLQKLRETNLKEFRP
jgi:hypothetical protein